MIKAVLFDFDGTLVNTNPLIIKTFELTFKQFLPERKFSDNDYLDCIGPTLEATFNRVHPQKASEMIDYYRKINNELHDQMIVMYPGVETGIKLLAEQGVTLGIVSSKRTDMVRRGLKFFGLDRYFSIVAGAELVKAHKPDPAPIFYAMAQLNVKQPEVIYIGDNSQDIVAGKNAGVITCGVAWAIRGAEYLKQFKPDYILEDIRDLLSVINEVNSNGNENL